MTSNHHVILGECCNSGSTPTHYSFIGKDTEIGVNNLINKDFKEHIAGSAELTDNLSDVTFTLHITSRLNVPTKLLNLLLWLLCER